MVIDNYSSLFQIITWSAAMATSAIRLPRLDSAVLTEENRPSRSHPSLPRTSSFFESSASITIFTMKVETCF